MAKSEFPKRLTHPDREDTRTAHNEFDVTRFAFEGYHPADVTKRIKAGRERIKKQADQRRQERMQAEASALTGVAPETAPTAKTTRRTKASTAKRTAAKAAPKTEAPAAPSEAQTDTSAL